MVYHTSPGYKAVALLFFLIVSGAISPFASTTRAQAPSTSGPLRVTEVYYDTPGVDADEEWLEVANLGDTAVDLDGVKVGDEEQLGGGEGMVRFPADAVLAPGQAVVVARSASGFRALFGRNPDYEIDETDPGVPRMVPYRAWATGDVALNNDGDEVLLVGPDDVIVDAVNYGDSSTFFAPSVLDVPQGQSIARVPADCDTDTAADWEPLARPTPGRVEQDGTCAAPSGTGSGTELVTIGAIQGKGSRSPLLNQVVTFRGLVTGVYEDRNAQGAVFYTVFVQDRPQAADGDPATSDAVAVFLGPIPPSVTLGDEVQVRGQVTEFYGFTEIEDDGLQLRLLSAGNRLPAPVVLEPPAGNAEAAYERLEAMRVSLPEARVVGPTFSGCGFAVVFPAVTETHIVRETVADPITNIVPVLHHSDVVCGGFPHVKVGDRIQNLVGPLIYHFDQFKIVHQRPERLGVEAVPVPDFPARPVLEAGQVSAASFNLHDYFNAVDDTGSDAEPKPAPAEVALKQEKLAAIIVDALGCPTLLGVQEVETRALLEALAEVMAAPCGFHYEISHRQSPDARGIDVALLTDPRRTRVEGVAQRQTCSEILTGVSQTSGACPQGQDPLFSRPPLEADVMVDNLPFTVIVNHFKSKREGEMETAPRRLAQAEHVSALAEEILEANADARVIAMGDFNDYAFSPPLDVLAGDAGPLLNTALRIPKDRRYSYNFGGASQLLDAILISPALVEEIVSSTIVHVNADFPAAWAAERDVRFRASDHDVPLVVLQVEEVQATATPASTVQVAAAPTPTEAPATDQPETRLPPTAAPVSTVEVAAANTPTAPPAADSPASHRHIPRWSWVVALATLAAVASTVAVLLWRRRV